MLEQSTDAGAIVVLTGAGISKESGLDTFRCADGIWSRVNLEDVATPEAFVRIPVWCMTSTMPGVASLDRSVGPNAAHTALARLEREWSGELLVVTQNIDDLHERAGSRNVLHMHGELKKVRVVKRVAASSSGWKTSASSTPAPGADRWGVCARTSSGSARCHRHGSDLRRARSLFAVHVRGHVGQRLPGSRLGQPRAYEHAAHTVELNLEPSTGATLFAETIYGPATEIVPAYVEAVLAAQWRRNPADL